jgi:predicted enzyme related to lactoylglutathione lyase
MKTRCAHVNVVAADWRRLARFYEDVFGCVPVPPERHLEGDWLSKATGVPGAALQGVHLRLPGYGVGGPTLEVFQYSEELERLSPAANRRGLGHVALEVEDVAAAVARVCSEGGRMLGDIVSREIRGAGSITFAYVTDPEDNVIELQHWSAESPPDS